MSQKRDERKPGRAPDDPIAAGLRRLWQEVEAEPVPESFLDLLDRIDAARDADVRKPADAPGGGQ
ncbi:MAG: NepR family anti-sigma factor [Sphingomonadaceae bacterium]